MILNVISFGYEVEDVGFYIYYFGIMGFLICVNILGNIFVMMIILCYWDLYINSNYLLVNQVVVDFLYGVFYFVYNFVQMIIVFLVVEVFGLWF